MTEQYLSDEELMKLMEQVETEEYVKAPEYLAEQILDKALMKRTENIVPIQKIAQEAEPKAMNKPPEVQKPRTDGKRKNKNPKQELLRYGLKVAVSIAASIAILLVVPDVDHSQWPEREENQQTTRPVGEALGTLHTATNQICSFLNQSSTDMLKNYSSKQ